MTMLRKVIPISMEIVGEDEVRIVMSTAALARDGHILEPQGCVLDNYRRNPIQLWQHDPDHPVGNNEDIQVNADNITALSRFAPLGISKKADEIRGLVKAGVIRAVSVSFDGLEGVPLDSKKPRGGQRFTRWELLECSWVSVPADTNALVTARANGEEETMPKPKTPAEKRAARAARQSFKPEFKRGLWDVAELAQFMQHFGWIYDSAKYEAMYEGDDSKVPAMLGEVLTGMGEALCAMTNEEVAEMLAGHDLEMEDDAADVVLVVEEREHIAAATSPKVRAWRRALAHAKQRAGKKLSAETARCLQDSQDMHRDAMEHHRAAMKAHKDGIAAVDDLMERAGIEKPAETPTTDDAGRSADFEKRQARKAVHNTQH